MATKRGDIILIILFNRIGLTVTWNELAIFDNKQLIIHVNSIILQCTIKSSHVSYMYLNSLIHTQRNLGTTQHCLDTLNFFMEISLRYLLNVISRILNIYTRRSPN